MAVPFLLHLRIPTDDGFFGMWLPWFIVYPILLALMLVALPIVLIAAIILLPLGKARPLLLAGPYLWRILFTMRGFQVDVQTGNRELLINFV